MEKPEIWQLSQKKTWNFNIFQLVFFYGKKTSVSNSTPCNDKRFLGKSECEYLIAYLN